MRIVIYIVTGAVGGMIIAFALCFATINSLRNRIKKLRNMAAEKRKLPKTETAKRIVWACLFNGFAWVWCSYILAWLDKVQIAETLSQVALTEIIATVLVYCMKAVIENLSKNNKWPDKAGRESREEGPELERDEPPDVGL